MIKDIVAIAPETISVGYLGTLPVCKNSIKIGINNISETATNINAINEKKYKGL